MRHQLLLGCGLLIGGCGGATPPSPPPPPPPTVVSVAVAPASLALANAGATGQLTATVTSTTGPVSNPTVSWVSANPAVATVSGTGAVATVTAVAPGTTQVTATVNQQSGTAAVTVSPPPPSIPNFQWRTIGAVTTHGAFGGGRWVAVGPQGKAYRSSDGARWEVATIAQAFSPAAIVWTGTRFAVIGAGGVFTSADGVTWSKATGIGQAAGPIPTRRSIVWTGTQLVASDGGALFRSADGLAWQSMSGAPAGGTTDLVWTGSVLAGNNGGGAGAVVVSADTGRTWSAPATLPSDLQLSGLAWDGSRFIKWRGRNFGTSPDGLVWTELATRIDWRVSGTVPPGGPIEDVQWIGDRYLALGVRSLNGSTFDAGALLSSPDGVDWTELDTGVHGTLTRVARGPADILVFGAATLYSTGGANWTMRLFDFDGGGGSNIRWSGDRFVVMEQGDLLVSANAIDWRRSRTPIRDPDMVAAWTGQLYIIGGSQGKIATSPNGQTWTVRSSGMSDNIRDMAVGGGRIVAMGQAGATTTSTDGLTWNARAVATGQLTDLEWTGQHFVVVGGNVAHVSVDGLSWQASTSSPVPIDRVYWTGTEFLGMNRFRVARSPDGLTWTLVGDIDQSASTLRLEGIERVGPLFVGCRTLTSRLSYSADLRGWQSAVAPEPIPTPCYRLGWSGTELLVAEQFGLEAGTRVP